MKPRFFEGKWYIEIHTEEFGNLFLLKKGIDLPIAITFDSEEEANAYIRKERIIALAKKACDRYDEALKKLND